ncbi:hypothetical protein CFIMG_007984RA [Ceratocystis fimbriata CBS 114723]|uniref:Uncharacterized protein n=1 Tax=Ceratocystis fimbriata CBS 114723 TaxID=1035309 RepID=A0A2C5WTV9_9PEZI|nr:hypothetical protein CFIMG_007984RA [Ceratocystis fimbriata CBS 114723]
MKSQAPDSAPQAPLLQPHSPQVAPTIDPQLLPATPLDDQPNDEAIEKHSTYLDKIARLRAGVEDKEYLNVDKESIATAINKLKGPAACYTTAQRDDKSDDPAAKRIRAMMTKLAEREPRTYAEAVNHHRSMADYISDTELIVVEADGSK